MKNKIFVMLLMIFIICSSVELNGFAAGEVTVDGRSMTISEDFSKSDIPAGFSTATIKYKEEQFKGIANQDDTIFMFYLVDSQDSNNNGFYVYTGNGNFSSGAIFTSAEKTLIVENPTDATTLPRGYSEIKEQFAGRTVTVFKKDVDDGSGNVLAYGTIDGKKRDWYLVNLESKLFTTYNIDSVEADKLSSLEAKNDFLNNKLSELNNKYNSNLTSSRMIFMGMVVVLVVFLFLMINAMLKRKHSALDYEDRILDLNRHGGKETLQVSEREKKRREKAQKKALERYKRAKEKYEEEMSNKRKSKNDNQPQKVKNNRNTAKRTTVGNDDANQIKPRKKMPPRNQNGSYDRTSRRNANPRRDLPNGSNALNYSNKPKKNSSNDIDVSSLEKKLTNMSSDIIKDVKKQPNPAGGVTGSMNFGDDLDIRTLDLDMD